jgi:DNA polymerase III delta prime subunit
MATLKELSSMTSELDELGGKLHAELVEGDIDFQKMVELADAISENADKLAEGFSTMSAALDKTLNGSSGDEDETEDAE